MDDERELVLVTAPGCHFCGHARTVLASLDLTAREVDVESDEAGELARSGVPLAFMPVLLDGREVLGYGRLSESALRRRLAA